MINGLAAGVLFLVWGGLGWRLGERVSYDWQPPFSIAWGFSLLCFLASAIPTLSECGNIGDVLIVWATLCAFIAMLFFGVTTAFFAVLMIGGAIGLLIKSATPDTWQLPEPEPETQKYLWVAAAVCFVLCCGWLGSLPAPFCP